MKQLSLSAYGMGLFSLVLGLYACLAIQGALPMLSPDETAVAQLAPRALVSGIVLSEPRAIDAIWLHPRSFVAQQGALLPVGFPLWIACLALVGWMGGNVALWMAAAVAASFTLPLVWLMARFTKLSRPSIALTVLAMATFPVAMLYGNRSFFTLMPQIACALWSCWLLVESQGRRSWLVAAGLACALTLGLRPTEAPWLLPFMVYTWVVLAKEQRSSFGWVCLGGLMGAGLVAAVHAWVYGSPFVIGYWLSSGSDQVLSTAAQPSAAPSFIGWRAFPYGFSLSRLRVNLVESWKLGFWPWMSAWVMVGIASLVEVWRTRSRERMVVLGLLVWTTAWLLFYYGQGSYADHIGGQAMHLGNSFWRYLAPAALGWMGYAAWFVLHEDRVRACRVVGAVLLGASVVGGTWWALADTEDGLLRGRRERASYQEVRAFVAEHSPASTIWLSDRSDKMLVGERSAVSPVPAKQELRMLLERGDGPAWLYARPPSQRERDAWLAEGIELVEQRTFAREAIYELRLREDRQGTQKSAY